MGAPVLVARIDRWSIRIDSAKIDESTGYMRVDGTASVVGVLEYSKADGAPYDGWTEFVPRSTLADPAFLDAMHHIPVTLEHPPVMLDAETTRRYQRGTVTRAWMDGDELRVSMLITDAEMIGKIRGGMDELSLGYHAKIDETPGVFQGRKYHALQAGRVPNHLAGVPVARAGKRASIDRLDAKGLGGWSSRLDSLRIARKDRTHMDEVEIEVGGVQYKVPQAVADALTAAEQKAKEAQSGGGEGAPSGDGDGSSPPATPSNDEGDEDQKRGDRAPEARGDAAPVTRAELNARLDAKFAEMGESLVKALDERDKRNDAAARQRAELVERARVVLPNSYKTDGKPDAEIMFDAICEAQPDLKAVAEANRKDAGVLRGMFQAALAMAGSGESGGNTPTNIKLDSSSGDPIAAARARQAQRRVDASKQTQVIGLEAARERLKQGSQGGGN